MNLKRHRQISEEVRGKINFRPEESIKASYDPGRHGRTHGRKYGTGLHRGTYIYNDLELS